MTEEVSTGEFASLKSDVHHMKSDVADMKGSNKETQTAIQSISVSLATIIAHVEQNQKLEPKIEKLQLEMKSVNIKIAAAGGGMTAIGLIIGYIAKLKGFL